MISYPYGALWAGMMLTVAGALTLTRHFLLEPVSTRYPKAPNMVRHGLFAYGCSLVFLGTRYVTVFIVNASNTIPPQPSSTMQFLSTMIAVYETILLVNIIRQRYPEEIWVKLNRLNDSLPCKERKFFPRINR